MAHSSPSFDWKAFSRQTWVVIAAGLFVPPVGMALAWLKPEWTTKTKWIATGLMGLMLLGYLGKSDSTSDTKAKAGRAESVITGQSGTSTSSAVTASQEAEADSRQEAAASSTQATPDPRVALLEKLFKGNGSSAKAMPETQKESAAPAKKSNEKLTADFLPYKRGAKASYETQMSKSLSLHHDWDFTEPNSIKIVTRMIQGGASSWENRSRSSLQYRKGGVFVELGQTIEGIGLDWQRLVNIGARQGDTWESDTKNPVKHRYTLDRFEDTDITAPPRRSAVIIDQAYDSSGEDEIMSVEWRLAEGLGLVEKRSNAGTVSSEMVLLGKGLGNKVLTKAEKAFFE